MPKRKRTYMPMGTAGLLSFQTERAGGIEIKPWIVIVGTIALIAVEIAVRFI